VSTREKKQTIGPEHVIKALKDLDFEEFVGDVTSAWEQFKEESKGKHGRPPLAGSYGVQSRCKQSFWCHACMKILVRGRFKASRLRWPCLWC